MAEENAKSFMKTVQSLLIGDPQHVEQIVAEHQNLQQQKDDLKFSFLESETKSSILGYLCKDPSTWPKRSEKDAKLKASRQEKTAAKKRYEEAKENVSVVIQTLCAEYQELEEKTEMLKEKLQIVEKKKEVFRSKWNLDPSTARAALEKCHNAIEKLESELSKHKQLKGELEASIESLKKQEKKQQRGVSVSSVENTVIERAQSVLAFLESMTGLKIQETSQNILTVKFTKADSLPVDGETSTTTLCLALTMYFNNSRLEDVQINVDHFNIKDIVDVAIADNDVPYLIRRVQERWSKHYPMLSEIEMLNKHHAIDWVQNQSRLRVLVGNCGRVMLTLAIPEDYPNSRDIKLVDTYGADNVDLDKLPSEGASLLDWVKCLEDLYAEEKS